MEHYDLKTGMLLVSEPFLPDPNFLRSVVLIAEHGERGSVGFVLNQKTNLLVHDVMDDFPEFDAPLYIGGPVERETLHFVHSVSHLIEGCYPVCEGVYWGGSFSQLKHLILIGKIAPNQVRFFSGYSGWIGGQLEDELAKKAWMIAQPKSEYVFSEHVGNSLWRIILSDMGDNYRQISNYPIHPSLN